MIGMMLWWVLVVAAIAWLVLARGGRCGAAAGHGSVERILEERFASGEIDADQLEARRAAIARRM